MVFMRESCNDVVWRRLVGKSWGDWIVSIDFNNVLKLGERLGFAVNLKEVASFIQCRGIADCMILGLVGLSISGIIRRKVRVECFIR